jgi:hypothetical protein
MHVRRFLLISTVLMLGICGLLTAATPATTITMTFSGTLGPVLSGSDPLGANGQSGTITAMVSESLTPTSKTSTSVTYTLPVGALSIVINGTTYRTPNTTAMKISVPATGASVLSVTTSITYLGITGTVVGTVFLAHGSFPKSIFTHPAPFTPTTQTLKAATSATGPGSKVKYTVFGGSTVLGLSGTATD